VERNFQKRNVNKGRKVRVNTGIEKRSQGQEFVTLAHFGRSILPRCGPSAGKSKKKREKTALWKGKDKGRRKGRPPFKPGCFSEKEISLEFNSSQRERKS